MPDIKCICDKCGKEFRRRLDKIKKFKNHFCSKECRISSYVKIKCNCDYCGKELFKSPCYVKRTKRNFCSYECHNKRVADKKVLPDVIHSSELKPDVYQDQA